MKRMWIAVGLLSLAGRLALGQASNVMTIDATGSVVAPQPVAMAMGKAVDPGGRAIGVNSQYLTMEGKPWLPVMGEFHFSRYPAEKWEQEILKMKAGGVTVVSSYVIWIHHEPVEGVYDWTGQNDLRRFVELCGKHGMYFYARIGPWSHAEVRSGGFPDWVLKAGPVRQNDPVYLKEVASFYGEIGKQLKGEFWKDGGPVIGVQIENEYREAKAEEGKGSEHIRTLKAMATAAGMDVPLYTVTGWDGAAIPLDAVLPVYGGYADAPWDGSNKALYGNGVYAFWFGRRVAGDMGAVGGTGSAAGSELTTPFLTAEMGGGGQDTYWRRPVYSPDDVAAVGTVILGSGANLLGYYMWQGGRNPESVAGEINESQRTGGATDTPVRSYDFQAPLGEFGQVRESEKKMKLVNYFLEDFGEELATMAVRAPAVTPSGPTDTSVPRVAARTNGDRGFVFVNNYVRGLAMPERKGFQVVVKMPGGVVKVPEAAIDLPAGAYGIWPVGLVLRGGREGTRWLRYSTAQLFKREGNDDGDLRYFFFGIPGIVPEFVFGPEVKVANFAGPVEEVRTKAGLRLRVRLGASAEIVLESGQHIVVTPEAEAEKVWGGGDPGVLVKTEGDAYADGRRWVVESEKPEMGVGVFGASKAEVEGVGSLSKVEKDGVFELYRAAVPGLALKAKVTRLAAARVRAPWEFSPPLSWRPQGIAMAPADAEFAGAAEWRIDVPEVPEGASVSDVWLRMKYQGDEARLYKAGALVDDDFWNGVAWEVGLREAGTGEFRLKVLPLPKGYPMYLERGDRLRFDGGVAGAVDEVSLVPEYRVKVVVSDKWFVGRVK